MKLITFYTPYYEEISKITIPRFGSYCKHHGIEFQGFRLPQRGGRVDFCWDKIELCRKVMSDVDDYLIWMDVDILLLKLSPSPYDFIKFSSKPMVICSDDNGICTGFFILKKCDWSIRYLDTMIFLGQITNQLERQINSVNAGDQSCAKYLLGFESVLKSTHILEDDGVISHPNRGIRSNTFAIHYWANGDLENKASILKNIKCDAEDYPV